MFHPASRRGLVETLNRRRFAWKAVHRPYICSDEVVRHTDRKPRTMRTERERVLPLALNCQAL